MIKSTYIYQYNGGDSIVYKHVFKKINDNSIEWLLREVYDTGDDDFNYDFLVNLNKIDATYSLTSCTENEIIF